MCKKSYVFYVRIVSIVILTYFTFQAVAVQQDTRSHELKYADKKLNKYYQKLLNKLVPSEQIKLKAAQRQWLVFRDLDCSWSFKTEPLDCLLERTENRLQEFQEADFFNKKGRYSSIKLDGLLDRID